MNKERFVAANVMAVVTHGIVSNTKHEKYGNLNEQHLNELCYVVPTLGLGEGEITDAARRQVIYWYWFPERFPPHANVQ